MAALIHHNFNDKDAVKLIALMANVSLLAPLLGPILGSAVVSYLSWHYVFIFTAAISAISLYGLYQTMPQDKEAAHAVDVSSLLKQYGQILKNKPFLQGALCTILAAMPVLFWISQAPNLVLYKLHQNYAHYVLYQVISIGGIVVSSFLMQVVAGKYKIANIIKTGIIIIVAGLLISFIGHKNILFVVIGEGIYTFGLGLSNSCLFRLVMSNKALPTGMTSSMLVFIQTLFLSLGIAFMNKIAYHFDYTLLSFTLTSLVFGCLAFVLTKIYIAFYHQREWE